MNVFVDTSALYAYLDRDDANHAAAKEVLPGLLEQRRAVTTNYVLLEAHALVQKRLGQALATELLTDVRPLLGLVWITAEIEEAAIAQQIIIGERQLSLVDCASFVVISKLNLRHAFSFDRHFRERNLMLPPPAEDSDEA
jgi:predicted nucleic acid-binding protein